MDPNAQRAIDIVAAYKEFLGREPESPDVVMEWINNPGTMDDIRAAIRDSEEGQAYAASQGGGEDDGGEDDGGYENPFGSEEGVQSPTDAGVHAMIEREKADWLNNLRTHASGFSDSGEGSNWEAVAQDELNAAIRQMRYADNAGTDPKRWLDEAKARITRRIQAGNTDGDTGDGDTDAGDGDTGSGDGDTASVNNATTTSNFAPRPAIPYNAGQQQPYSASPSGPVRTAPPPFMGSMGDVVMPSGVGIPTPSNAAPLAPPAQQASPQAANAWKQADYNYAQAGQDYANGPNGAGYSPAPWEQSRDRFGGPRKEGEIGERWPNQEPWGKQRTDQFARRSEQDNQDNANLGTAGFNQQMDNWLRAYNQWNEKGASNPASLGRGVPTWR